MKDLQTITKEDVLTWITTLLSNEEIVWIDELSLASFPEDTTKPGDLFKTYRVGDRRRILLEYRVRQPEQNAS